MNEYSFNYQTLHIPVKEKFDRCAGDPFFVEYIIIKYIYVYLYSALMGMDHLTGGASQK